MIRVQGHSYVGRAVLPFRAQGSRAGKINILNEKIIFCAQQIVNY
jgi:hypothetical protein